MTIFGSDGKMRAVKDTSAALGPPVFVRVLGAQAEPTAAIARWRHGGAIVDVAPSNTVRVAMSLLNRRNAHDRSGSVPVDRAQGSSVSVFSPTEGATVEVSGDADVVQLFLDLDHVEATLATPFACPPMFALRDDWMRTTLMRILVGSARRAPDDALKLDEGLHALALRIKQHATQSLGRDRLETPSVLFHGGLAPAAFRRVEAMMEAALDGPGSPTLADMADAIGLSVTHFVRVFRRHTGSTPHQYLVRRRMDRALSLLSATKSSVREVADRVGFATPAHFVATFRATMGVTPAAVRDALAG